MGYYKLDQKELDLQVKNIDTLHKHLEKVALKHPDTVLFSDLYLDALYIYNYFKWEIEHIKKDQ